MANRWPSSSRATDKTKEWDLKVVNKDGRAIVWEKLNLLEISQGDAPLQRRQGGGRGRIDRRPADRLVRCLFLP